MRAPLLLAFVACAPSIVTPPDYRTPLGAEVWTHGHASFDADTVAQMERFTVESLVTVPGFVREDVEACAGEAQVGVFSLPEVVRLAEGRQVAGQQVGRVLRVAVYGECPWASAYVHELAHWLQTCRRYGPDDLEHDLEPGVWLMVEARPACPAGVET